MESPRASLKAAPPPRPLPPRQRDVIRFPPIPCGPLYMSFVKATPPLITDVDKVETPILIVYESFCFFPSGVAFCWPRPVFPLEPRRVEQAARLTESQKRGRVPLPSLIGPSSSPIRKPLFHLTRVLTAGISTYVIFVLPFSFGNSNFPVAASTSSRGFILTHGGNSQSEA